MSYSFLWAASFDINIGCWNVASVTSLSYAFPSATAFNQNIGSWNTARLVEINSAFQGVSDNWDLMAPASSASRFDRNIAGWNTASLTSMAKAFYASTLNQDLGSWNTASVRDMTSAFASATIFNQDLGSWNVLRVTLLTSIFASASALSDCNKRAIYNGWGSTLQLEYLSWSTLCGPRENPSARPSVLPSVQARSSPWFRAGDYNASALRKIRPISLDADYCATQSRKTQCAENLCLLLRIFNSRASWCPSSQLATLSLIFPRSVRTYMYACMCTYTRFVCFDCGCVRAAPGPSPTPTPTPSPTPSPTPTPTFGGTARLRGHCWRMQAARASQWTCRVHLFVV
jgi:surface protein